MTITWNSDNTSVDITCEYCGKPITKTSPQWGMDCEDDCAQNEARKMFGGLLSRLVDDDR
jgi:hypothetical protein